MLKKHCDEHHFANNSQRVMACERIPSPQPIAAGPPVSEIDRLVEGFDAPLDVAKPLVWWHWLGGNVTEEGVRLDFEWMKRVGIQGVTNIDAAFENWGPVFDTPLLVEKPLVYLSPEWRRTLRYSVGLANESGLEFGIDSSPGFSETGGPWVRPHQAMKKLVWSETPLQGGVPFNGFLPSPPETTGLFQEIPFVDWRTRGNETSAAPTHYANVATIAYRAPVSEISLADLDPSVSSSAGKMDGELLFDGDLVRAISLPFGEDRYAWIQFSFPAPQRIQAVTAVIARPLSLDPLRVANPNGWLEASDDGQVFRKVVDLPGKGALQQTVSFQATTARMFRIVLERPEPSIFERMGLTAPPSAHNIAELMLHKSARVNRFEDKAGFSVRQILDEDDTPTVTNEDTIRKNDIIDLTRHMLPDGYLDWMPPAGRWIILRFGYSLTGRSNHPESRAGTGLEVDKLNRAHVKAYIDAYLGEYEKALGPEPSGLRGIRHMTVDSYEVGPQNWTDDMLEQFRKRRGYDLLPWLPVLTGRVLEGAAASDRLLWDFRKTIGELMAEAHYGQISASLRERGMGLYVESHEHGRAFIGDGMEVKRMADFPMGAIWASRVPGRAQENYDADIRESASVAHIYGKKIVAAESFTAHGNSYGFAPEILKPVADRGMAMGINRFVIHASVHQPDNKLGPGLGLGPFGTWFTRHETWADQAGSWIAYLARSSFLLQQGRFVADIAYLYGEDSNVTFLFNTSAPSIPEGYNFDFVNPGALVSEFSAKDGRLITRAGTEYRVLVLDSSTHRMSLPILRKIRELIWAGAIVVGSKPATTPSLADDEDEFRAIVAEIWNEEPRQSPVGSGRIIAGRSLTEALVIAEVEPDVAFTKRSDAELRFVHRNLEDGDLYFVSNGSAIPQIVEADFRVSDMAPEIWKADTGTIAPLSYRMVGGRTIVPLKLDPNDAVFVVFRHLTSVQSAVIPELTTKVLCSLEGSWAITFPSNSGAPDRGRFERLHSWTESTDDGVRYFSGTASYHKTAAIPREWLKEGSRVWLDLGEVKNLAEVLVNGRELGVLWKRPFVLDVTDALIAGENNFLIKVTNLWPNRLIGDKQPGANRIAFATHDPFKADSRLLPSGLLGPVVLIGVYAQ